MHWSKSPPKKLESLQYIGRTLTAKAHLCGAVACDLLQDFGDCLTCPRPRKKPLLWNFIAWKTFIVFTFAPYIQTKLTEQSDFFWNIQRPCCIDPNTDIEIYDTVLFFSRERMLFHYVCTPCFLFLKILELIYYVWSSRDYFVVLDIIIMTTILFMKEVIHGIFFWGEEHIFLQCTMDRNGMKNDRVNLPTVW